MMRLYKFDFSITVVQDDEVLMFHFVPQADSLAEAKKKAKAFVARNYPDLASIRLWLHRIEEI